MQGLVEGDLPALRGLGGQSGEDVSYGQFSPSRASGGEGSERRVHGRGCRVRGLLCEAGSGGVFGCRLERFGTQRRKSAALIRRGPRGHGVRASLFAKKTANGKRHEQTKKDLDRGLNDYHNYIVHSYSVKSYPDPLFTLSIWRLSGKRNVP